MYHRIILAGNLGGDPDLRYTPTGQAVCNLSVATNRTWKNDQGKQKEVCWFRCTLWGTTAENAAKYLSKGRGVIIEGRMNPDENGNPRTWTAKDGSVRTSFEVVVDRVQYLPGKGEGQDQGQGSGFGDVPFLPEDVSQEDLWDQVGKEGSGV